MHVGVCEAKGARADLGDGELGQGSCPVSRGEGAQLASLEGGG